MSQSCGYGGEVDLLQPASDSIFSDFNLDDFKGNKMKTIIVKTQAELDALPEKFEEYTQIQIHGGTRCDRIIVRQAYGNSSVKAYGNSSVAAWGNSSVEARDNSSVEAYGNSSVIESYH